MHLADLASYTATQSRVSDLYVDRRGWGRKAILNVAQSGKFSSDRTIAEYAETDLGSNALSRRRVRSRHSAIAPIIVANDTFTSKWRVIYEKDDMGPRPDRARGSGFGGRVAVVEARAGERPADRHRLGERQDRVHPGRRGRQIRRSDQGDPCAGGRPGRGGTGPRQDGHRRAGGRAREGQSEARRERTSRRRSQDRDHEGRKPAEPGGGGIQAHQDLVRSQESSRGRSTTGTGPAWRRRKPHSTGPRPS